MTRKASRLDFLLKLRSLTAILLGLLVCGFLIALVGENPIAVFQIFYRGALGSAYDLGYSLFYAVPLVFTALAVSIGLRARLFNIGVEGQLTVAALAAAIMGFYGPEDPILNRSLGCLAALLGGFLWGALLGYLRAFRQAHEVVTGIMLNFIAYGLTSWLALNFFKNPHNQNPETSAIADTIRIQAWQFFEAAPLGWHALLAVLAALLVWALYRFTELGFAMELSGANPEAARHAGISIPAMQFWALSLGGLLAGLVGFIEVYGNSGRFVVGFSPGYGFMGIAVALVGRNRAFGILAAALVFGCMHKGSLDLDFETEWVTRDFALVMQAILILFMSCSSLVPPRFLRIWQRLRGRYFGYHH